MFACVITPASQVTHTHGCCMSTQLHLHEYQTPFSSHFIFGLLFACCLPCSFGHAHTFPHPGIHGGIVAPVFTYEFAANAFVDKPVNNYFPARVSLNKCSHEYSFASKFLDKSSSVDISATTCFGICLPIHIWRYTCLKIHIHMWLCMRMQVQRISPRAFLFLPTPFQPGFCCNKYSHKKQAMGEANVFKANHSSYSSE